MKGLRFILWGLTCAGILQLIVFCQMMPSEIEGAPIYFGSPRALPLPLPYTFADVLDALCKKKGITQIDLEQGGFTDDRFGHLIDFDKNNYLDALQTLLNSSGYGYEMRGSVMVIYDKKLRSLGEQYPLNRTISSLKLHNVSLRECFTAIGRQIHARIDGDAGPMVGSNPSVPLHTFNVELHNITLREALFKIDAQYGCRGWETITMTIGNKTRVFISIQ